LTISTRGFTSLTSNAFRMPGKPRVSAYRWPGQPPTRSAVPEFAAKSFRRQERRQSVIRGVYTIYLLHLPRIAISSGPRSKVSVFSG
jgi:hypothetical protein